MVKLKPIFALLFLLIGIQLSVSAQLFGSKTDTSGMIWRIRFNLDVGLSPLSTKVRDSYAGEYYHTPTQTWQWRSWDSTRTGLHKLLPPQGVTTPRILQTVSGQLNVSMNLYKNFYLGFNYTPLIIQDYSSTDSNSFNYYKTIALVGLGTSFGYDFIMPFHKRLSLQPVISLGGYADGGGEGYYEGLGSEWFKEVRLGITYRAFKYDQLRVLGAWNQFSYRENLPSIVFPDKNRTVNSDVSSFYIGIGYVVNLYIKEEIETVVKVPKVKKSRKADKE